MVYSAVSTEILLYFFYTAKEKSNQMTNYYLLHLCHVGFYLLNRPLIITYRVRVRLPPPPLLAPL